MVNVTGHFLNGQWINDYESQLRDIDHSENDGIGGFAKSVSMPGPTGYDLSAASKRFYNLVVLAWPSGEIDGRQCHDCWSFSNIFSPQESRGEEFPTFGGGRDLGLPFFRSMLSPQYCICIIM